MSSEQNLSDRYQGLFLDLDADLANAFEGALLNLPLTLTTSQLRTWAEKGLDLARGSAQVAVAYFNATPRLLAATDFSTIPHVTELALELTDRSPLVAAAFLQATPDFLLLRQAAALSQWANQGSRLCRGTWKSAALAQRFFDNSATLMQTLSAQEMDKLVAVIRTLSGESIDLASSCLERAATVFASLATTERLDFLILADLIVRSTWSDVWHYFESGPDLLRSLAAEQRSDFLRLVTQISAVDKSPPLPILADIATAMAEIATQEHAELIQLAHRLATSNATAALEFLKSAPFLRKRISREALHGWLDRGLALSDNREAVEAFFRVDTATADQLLGSLSGRVEFERVGSMLRLYGTALGGEQVHVQSTRSLTERVIGWITEDAATTDGRSIFVPPVIDQFGDQKANLQVYKVCIAHQASRLAFGSFTYEYGRNGHYLAASVTTRSRQLDNEPSLPGTAVSMQRYFDLFQERRLIGDLFTLVEDTRIDACIQVEYRGLRSCLLRLRSANERPKLLKLGLREAFLENLLRASLGQTDSIRWPEKGIPGMTQAVAALQLVTRPGASVEDSAEIAALLFDLAIRLPNFPANLMRTPWMPLPRAVVADGIGQITEVTSQWAANRWWLDEVTTDALEQPYEIPSQPFFRGGFKPELVQALTSLDEDRESISVEQLRQLLENSEEIEGEHVDVELLIDNIDAEFAQLDDDLSDDEIIDDEPRDEDVSVQIEWSYYDEWDFRANDYRPAWCHVGERSASEGDLKYYGDTLQQYHGLVTEMRRQFELMRPETFRKLKRLEDGDEIDLDQAIEFRIDKKAGAGPLARFYSRRDKVERSVAVAFLLDMSASTEDEIVDRSRTAEQSTKRIIDLEKESAVLIIEALEAVGDSYGIYGFSGHGRKNVAFYVIKELDQELDDSIRKRVDSIEPLGATRMGAAIRHAQAKLLDFPAKVRILMLVSDGRPQDQDYGLDRNDNEYGIHDTKQALVEGVREGIVPFLITVDQQGPDYLKEICTDISYEVVANVESLPERLPRIYRQLARG